MKHINIITLTIFILVTLSCNNKKTETKSVVKKEATYKLTNAKINSEGTYLFSNKKQIIINWTEWSDDSKKNNLKFAFFDNTTKKFKKTQQITPALGLQIHTESMAKVGITKKGVLYAIYRRKSTNPKQRFGGLLYYSISKDNGINWSKEQKLINDKNATSQSFFDIALLSDGELGMIWLDNRKPIDKDHKGKTLFFAKTNSDKGFQKEQPIAGSTCECCRTDFYVDKQNNIHIAYRDLIDKNEPNFDGNGKIEIRDMYYISSKDNGKSFSKPMPISKDNWHINGCPHTGPSMAFNQNKLATVWFTAANNKNGIYFTTKSNKGFNKRILLTNNGSHPQMVSLVDKFYIVYEVYYENLEKGYTKIVLETIDKLSSRKTYEISREHTNNNHAVLIPINKHSILVSWINNDTRNPRIEYKIINDKLIGL